MRLQRRYLYLSLWLTVFCGLSSTVHAHTYRLVTTAFKPFTDPKHEKGGFLVEIARQALAKRGHKINVTYLPWARAMREAATGRYDGLLSAFYNEERAKTFYFSAPLNTTKMVLVGLRDKIKKTSYKSLSELAPYTIAIGHKWAYSEAFEKNTVLNKYAVNDEPTGIRMLYNNRVDLFAVNIDQFNYAIKHMPEFNRQRAVVLEPEISINDHHIAASRLTPSSLDFLAEFNTGLAAIKASGEYANIKHEFFGF